MNNRSFSSFIIICFLFLSYQIGFSQQTQYFKEYRKLSRPEKRWATRHPFIAKKAFILTEIARKATDSLKKASVLDKDASGGQLDAFRHSYWMALLSMHFNSRKAINLGKAHEKGNYLSYKKHQIEEEDVADSISSKMDLYNNMIGSEIGKKFKTQSQKVKVQNNAIQKIILFYIITGKMIIIKKNKKGDFLDINGDIIPADSLKNKWVNNKCLVPSGFIRPE